MSSITTILNNGYLGLTSQTKALGTISDNIANASTTGYRGYDTQFGDLVLNDRFADTSGASGGDGVRAYTRLTTQAGTLKQTGVTTNAAIVGNGFFVVQDLSQNGSATAAVSQNNLQLTRAGDFQPDVNGNLVNAAGKTLMGFKLDPADPTTSTTMAVGSLTPVNVAGLTSYYEPSTTASLEMNLPTTQTVATAPTTDNTVGASLRLIDKSGQAGSVNLRFMKTGEGTDGSSSWEVYAAGTTAADGSAVDGPSASDPTTWQSLGAVNFSADGTLTGGTTGTPLALALNPGGNFGPVSLTLGNYGDAGFSTTSIAGFPTSIAQGNNGIPANSYQSVDIGDDGVVTATFSGGQSRAVYRIPDGVVTSEQGLEDVSGTAFQVTPDSGDLKLMSFGVTPSGAKTSTGVGATLNSTMVEGSNVDISNQFTTLIQAQRTYSANSKIVSTADEMTQTVVGIMAN